MVWRWDGGSAARCACPAELGTHRGRRSHQAHRRDQPAQRLPGGRCRHGHEHAVHHACRLGAGRRARDCRRRRARGRRPGRRSAARRAGQLGGDPVPDPAGRRRRDRGRRRGPWHVGRHQWRSARRVAAARGHPGRDVDGRTDSRHDPVGAAGCGHRGRTDGSRRGRVGRRRGRMHSGGGRGTGPHPEPARRAG